MNRVWLAFALLGAVAPAHAGTIYTCKDAKGQASYQEVPCAGAQKTAAVRALTPEANGGPTWSSQVAATHQWSSGPAQQQPSSSGWQPQQTQSTVMQAGAPQQAASSSRTSSLNPTSADFEAQRRREIEAESCAHFHVCSTRSGSAVASQPVPQAANRSGVVYDEYGVPIAGAVAKGGGDVYNQDTGKYYWTHPDGSGNDQVDEEQK